MNLKKSALSVAVAGALGVVAMPAVAGEAGAYGRLDVGLQSVDDGTDSILDVQGVNSRFGFKGSEDLGNGWEAMYRYEFRVFGDRAQIQDENRLSYVGLKGDIGGIYLGRQWSAFFNHIGTYLDPTSYPGTGYSNGAAAGPYRVSNTVKYAGSAGAVSFDVDLVADTGGNEKSVDAYSAGATFGGGAFAISGGINNVAAAGSADDDQLIGIAGSYNLGKTATIRAGFTQRSDASANDASMIGINATIRAGGGLSFLVLVDSTTDDDTGTTAATNIEADNFVLGAYKKMSSRTQVYAELRSTSPNVGDNTSTIYGAIRHDF